MKHHIGALAVVLCGLLSLAGCTHNETRLQAADETEKDPVAEVKTIGEVTSVANATPIPVSGVGLVVGLDGTGGGTPPGSARSVLEHDLKAQGVEDIAGIFNSPNAALVLVSALIPPGAHKGDQIDVDVTLPPQSKATSLRGGYLRSCTMYNYDSTHNLVPTTARADQMVRGHPLAHAEGALLVGFGEGDEATQAKQGRIWGGGKSAIDRSFYLTLNSDQQFVRVAVRVATRINETFQGPYHGPGSELAKAETKQVVYLHVPNQYKLNVPRFLRLVRLIPLQEAPAPTSPYRKKLEEDLLDPAKTITTALRLEALGSDSIPAFKRGLTSTHILVRFASAEALAYLACPACGEELAKLIKQQPTLRAYCLTALASFDEAVCHVELRELLSNDSAEVRYGAFRALRALDESESCLHGELLNDSFWLHRVANGSSSLVHFSTSRRAEIVLFGGDPLLDPPFSFRAGPDFIVSAGQDDDHCMVTRVTVQKGRDPKQCSLKLSEVLHLMADMGGQYPDAVELLRQIDQIRCLSCKVVADALPEAMTVYDLARTGATSDEELKSDQELRQAQTELTATPTLFEDGAHNRRRHGSDEDAGAGGQ